MRRAGAYLRTIWTIYYLYLKQIAVDGMVIFTVIVQPLIVALLAIYMLRETQGFQAIYVIVGSALTGLWSATIYISSRGIEHERWSGTLETIVASPTHVATIILGKSLANLTLSLCSMLFSYPLAAFFFGYRLAIAEPFFFSISLILTVVALISMGLVIAPIMSMNPGAAVWSNALEFPMFILGGFLFPISLLPIWASPISYALPPYWAAQALHATSSGGAPFSDVLVSWISLGASSVGCWFIAAWLFGLLLRRAKIQATLGLQ